VTDEERPEPAAGEPSEAGAAFFPVAPLLPPASDVTDVDAAAPLDAAAPRELAAALEPMAPTRPLEPPPPARPPIPLVATRGLLPAAFDLILRSNEDMRRASFYIGAVTLGTVGPLALGLWAVVVSGQAIFDPSTFEPTSLEGSTTDVSGLIGLLGVIAVLGFLVAAIESRTLATAVLGGQMAGRPITLRHAVARARARFWPAIGASFIVGVVLAVCQGIVDAIVSPVLGAATEAAVITSTVVTATVGAPFAYVLCGIVLGDVSALESIRRSFMVARARWGAAAIIVTFETLSVLLILFGLSAGADVLLRGFDVLGIGPDSGPAGLAIATVVLIAGVFALGTLLYTVSALTVAPQVVMFVGLTHATVGLDRIDRPERPRFFSIPMRIGVALAILLLTIVVLSA